MAPSDGLDPSYTVFIRLPFPRGDFVDPPAVDWDAAKEAQLWKILSKASKNAAMDWNSLAQKFDVSLPFLLQQAAWLYERQLSQVRAQMRKFGASRTSAQSCQSPVPGSDNAGGGEAMRRAGSSGGGRKDSPIPKNDGSISNTPLATPLSRTPSTNTAIYNRTFPQTSPRPAKANLHRLSISPPILRPTPPGGLTSTGLPKSKNASSSEAAESSSSDSSSDSEPIKSRMIRRPPRFPSHNIGRTRDGDEEDEDAPAFLPFSTPAGQQNKSSTDPSATLRGNPPPLSRRSTAKKTSDVIQQSQTSDSSASSTTPMTKPVQRGSNHPQRPPGPLSPRRTAELTGRSPVGKGKGMGREGSDGTPSMGSSFSDLDDASVTQSALEEALASNMQQGGMASRMSTISQALRSRYL